jgi:hypothetical protein
MRRVVLSFITLAIMGYMRLCQMPTHLSLKDMGGK